MPQGMATTPCWRRRMIGPAAPVAAATPMSSRDAWRPVARGDRPPPGARCTPTLLPGRWHTACHRHPRPGTVALLAGERSRDPRCAVGLTALSAGAVARACRAPTQRKKMLGIAAGAAWSSARVLAAGAGCKTALGHTTTRTGAEACLACRCASSTLRRQRGRRTSTRLGQIPSRPPGGSRSPTAATHSSLRQEVLRRARWQVARHPLLR